MWRLAGYEARLRYSCTITFFRVFGTAGARVTPRCRFVGRVSTDPPQGVLQYRGHSPCDAICGTPLSSTVFAPPWLAMAPGWCDASLLCGVVLVSTSAPSNTHCNWLSGWGGCVARRRLCWLQPQAWGHRKLRIQKHFGTGKRCHGPLGRHMALANALVRPTL